MASREYLIPALQSYMAQTDGHSSSYSSPPSHNIGYQCQNGQCGTGRQPVLAIQIDGHIGNRPTMDQCRETARRVNPSGTAAYAEEVYHSYSAPKQYVYLPLGNGTVSFSLPMHNQGLYQNTPW